jgi:hypothetical protein
VAQAAVVAREAEVEADRLRVADVQVAVRLGRKAGADRRRVGRPAPLLLRRARRAQRRVAYFPAARSASTMLRMKFVTCPAPVGGGAEGVAEAVAPRSDI